MTFTWTTPPWQRNENCTHLAVVLNAAGDGEISLISESVRGDNATEALADLLMGPGGVGNTLIQQSLVGVVIRRGIDVMWMAQPPIHVARTSTGAWEIGVEHGEDEEVTGFSRDDAYALLAQLRAAYPTA